MNVFQGINPARRGVSPWHHARRRGSVGLGLSQLGLANRGAPAAPPPSVGPVVGGLSSVVGGLLSPPPGAPPPVVRAATPPPLPGSSPSNPYGVPFGGPPPATNPYGTPALPAGLGGHQGSESDAAPPPPPPSSSSGGGKDTNSNGAPGDAMADILPATSSAGSTFWNGALIVGGVVLLALVLARGKRRR